LSSSQVFFFFFFFFCKAARGRSSVGLNPWSLEPGAWSLSQISTLRTLRARTMLATQQAVQMMMMQ
jgi:hypothetical protein